MNLLKVKVDKTETINFTTASIDPVTSAYFVGGTF